MSTCLKWETVKQFHVWHFESEQKQKTYSKRQLDFFLNEPDCKKTMHIGAFSFPLLCPGGKRPINWDRLKRESRKSHKFPVLNLWPKSSKSLRFHFFPLCLRFTDAWFVHQESHTYPKKNKFVATARDISGTLIGDWGGYPWLNGDGNVISLIKREWTNTPHILPFPLFIMGYRVYSINLDTWTTVYSWYIQSTQ